jgi:hypothetical protein
MGDCTDATMKDLLPDLLHDRLAVALRAEVEAHVSACDDCRAELRILRQVVAVTATPRVDASRIVAALPRYRAPFIWQRAVRSTQLRVAAAIVLLAGGAAVVSHMMTRPGSTPVTANAPVGTDSSIALAPNAAPAVVGSTPVAAATSQTPGAVSAELALGETLHDLSDTDLRALLDELGTLEAVTPTETDVVAPAVRDSQ